MPIMEVALKTQRTFMFVFLTTQHTIRVNVFSAGILAQAS